VLGFLKSLFVKGPQAFVARSQGSDTPQKYKQNGGFFEWMMGFNVEVLVTAWYFFLRFVGQFIRAFADLGSFRGRFCVLLASILRTIGVPGTLGIPSGPLGATRPEKVPKSSFVPPSPPHREPHFETFSTKKRYKVDSGCFFQGLVRGKYGDAQTWLFRPQSVTQWTLENTKIEQKPNSVVQKQRGAKTRKWGPVKKSESILVTFGRHWRVGGQLGATFGRALWRHLLTIVGIVLHTKKTASKVSSELHENMPKKSVLILIGKIRCFLKSYRFWTFFHFPMESSTKDNFL